MAVHGWLQCLKLAGGISGNKLCAISARYRDIKRGMKQNLVNLPL